LESARLSNPRLPDELGDRAQDNAQGLFSLADLISDGIGEEARRMLLLLSERLRHQTDLSPNTQLLFDTREIFERSNKNEFTSKELIKELCQKEESPWGSWKGRQAISPRELSGILRPFHIEIYKRSDARVWRVFDFHDAFARYLSAPPVDAISCH